MADGSDGDAGDYSCTQVRPFLEVYGACPIGTQSGNNILTWTGSGEDYSSSYLDEPTCYAPSATYSSYFGYDVTGTLQSTYWTVSSQRPIIGWRVNPAYGPIPQMTLGYDRPRTAVAETDQWDDQCPTLSQGNGTSTRCEVAGAARCVDGPATKSIDGVPVTRACWRYETPLSCPQGAGSNECSPLIAAGCTPASTTCRQINATTGVCEVTENSYTCDQDSVKAQLARLTGLGVRQIITIHEFDNAFGGNGIFDGLVLNAGNRENSGGIPSHDIAQITGLLSGGPSDISPLGYLQTAERPTGEFWTTYDCPEETPSFQYLWGNSGGADMTSLYTTGLPDALCPFVGQGGRAGGALLCYPKKKQCNARWMTPMGLFTYKLLMEKGLIFDIDHLELEMKTQALELAEAQPIAYPFVSTHGTFGGTTNDQARRILKNQGFLYPSLGNGPALIRDMTELKAVWQTLPEPRPLFGFGFGTDTNGLSAQASPRGNVSAAKAVKYPFQLFTGTIFKDMPDFTGKTAVTFAQPEERNAAGVGRTWSLDEDGSAHYGMLSDFVQEMRLEGTPQNMQDLFNSAERYLRTWQKTLDASDAIVKAGGAKTPAGILRPAPKPANPLALPAGLPAGLPAP